MQKRDNISSAAVSIASAWYRSRNWNPFPFQLETVEKYCSGHSGIVNAPTGSGKTFSIGLAPLAEYIAAGKPKIKGLQVLWLNPLKALSTDIRNALEDAAGSMGTGWTVGLRTGDTSSSERQKLRRNPPNILITTPESLHLMLCTPGYEEIFSQLQCVITDEWHELMGNKRGVQVELALSRLRAIRPQLRTWGISATIGNLHEAMNVLIPGKEPRSLIRHHRPKKVQSVTLIPKSIEILPWAGHLGIRMLDQVAKVISENNTTLIFTNTRSQSEIWYRHLMESYPELHGRVAMHHGSLSQEIRTWVEESLHKGSLKAVVCTSSLDLGVDFRPVDAVVQIGSPKGVARYMQRGGRSGHNPFDPSRIWFVPTHAIELLEARALRRAVSEQKIEPRTPVIRAFDVLIQYLVSLSVGGGFSPEIIYREITATHAFGSVSEEEWDELIRFLLFGGKALKEYEDFHKVFYDNHLIKIKNRRLAMIHRLSIGTIESEQSMAVKFLNGKKLGTIEEYFISSLKENDTFVFSGQMLRKIRTEGNTVYVEKSRSKTGKVPSWMGGRMSLSSEMSELLRTEISNSEDHSPERKALGPLLQEQQYVSHLPGPEELLIEQMQTDDGYHLFVFPFEGRMVNEGLAMLLAYRLAQNKKISFSIAMNDYGFELLSDQPIELPENLKSTLFRPTLLEEHLSASVNYHEMTRKRFSGIASIAGLVFKGMPGNAVRHKHLQATSKLFYDVFREYEPDHLLLRQAQEEVFYLQLDEVRLRNALLRIQQQKIICTRPEKFSPFCFPIMADRFREQLSSESMEDRIRKILQERLGSLD